MVNVRGYASVCATLLEEASMIRTTILTALLLATVSASAAEPAPSPTRVPGKQDDFLYKATLAPDAFLTYIQLVPHERQKYRFYARHMNETQRLEYLRRVRSEDRERYARDIGLPEYATIPEPTRTQVLEGRVDLGMTKEQVQLALGDPAGKMLGAGKLNGKHYDAWEKWTYQRKEGALSVWFASDKVVGYDPTCGPCAPADENLPPEDDAVRGRN